MTHPQPPAQQQPKEHPDPEELLKSLILWLSDNQTGAIIRPYGEEKVVMVLDCERTIKQIKAMWPRSHPAPTDEQCRICSQAIERKTREELQQRIDALDLLKKKIAWGKEIDRNHLFSYQNIEEMIEEAEQRIALLQAGRK